LEQLAEGSTVASYCQFIQCLLGLKTPREIMLLHFLSLL
jgi:hypothetical protein